MAKNNNLTDFLISLANKIREKLSLNEAINPQDFENKVDEIYEKGKKSQYNEFWDEYQNGNVGGMDWAQCTFAGNHWTNKSFKPKFDICPTVTAQYLFFFSAIKDLDTAIKNAGIKFDLSKCQTINNAFQNYTGEIVPEISTISSSELSSLFGYCASLHTIKKLVLKDDGSQSFSGTFTNCYKLANIIIEGIIGKNIDFKSCPLTKDSILSIITHLSNEVTGKTLSLKASTTNAIDWSNTIIDDVTYNTFDEICDLRTNWTISLI